MVHVSLGPVLDLLTPLLFGLFLILARTATLVYWLPAVTGGIVPTRIRVAWILLVAIVLDMGLGGVLVELPSSPLLLVATVFREILIGGAMGMAIRLLLSAMEIAGSLAGITMGLSMNVFVDPASGDQSLSLGALLGVSASLVFIALDGHHIVLFTLMKHLEHYPVGELTLLIPDAAAIASAGTDMVNTAMRLAAPAVVTALILHCSLAFITRVMPTANLFGIGLGVIILGALLSLTMVGDAIVTTVDQDLRELPARMVELTGTHIRAP